MKLIIVSGLSGAGKTQALHTLEDRGVYCIDNLPISLLPAIAEQMPSLAASSPCVAVGIDVRNSTLRELPHWLEALQAKQINYEVLFLEAEPKILLKRFSETRRKHPLTLTRPDLSLAEALELERKLLSSLSEQAALRIDTSQTNVHQLRDLIRLRVGLHSQQIMPLLFLSFGFKHGMPQDVDFVFDVRCLPNPHWEQHLRTLSGRDRAVIEFLSAQPTVQAMKRQIVEFLENWIPQFEADSRSYLSVALGCTGGQHRSVFMAEKLAQHFRAQREGVLIRHRELS